MEVPCFDLVTRLFVQFLKSAVLKRVWCVFYIIPLYWKYTNTLCGFLQQWLSILLTMSRKRPPKPWYLSIKGRTNTNIKDNLFANSKINIILFCYFVYQSVYKKALKLPKLFNRTEWNLVHDVLLDSRRSLRKDNENAVSLVDLSFKTRL